MGNMTWNPLQEVEALRRDMLRVVLGDAFGGRPVIRVTSPGRHPLRAGRGFPLLNVRPTKEALVVEALAPGIAPESLNVSFLRNELTISGERPAPALTEGTVLHRQERATGRFTRTLRLDVEIDEENIRADYRDGILRITLPRAQATKARLIRVNAN